MPIFGRRSTAHHSARTLRRAPKRFQDTLAIVCGLAASKQGGGAPEYLPVAVQKKLTSRSHPQGWPNSRATPSSSTMPPSRATGRKSSMAIRCPPKRDSALLLPVESEFGHRIRHHTVRSALWQGRLQQGRRCRSGRGHQVLRMPTSDSINVPPRPTNRPKRWLRSGLADGSIHCVFPLFSLSVIIRHSPDSRHEHTENKHRNLMSQLPR
jgi:hypothetical protein